MQVRGSIVIDFTEYGADIPCLKAAQVWYNSYRANIVTYSLAIFHHALKKKFPAAELNLLAVWKAQRVPAEFAEIFKAITRAVNDLITGKRPNSAAFPMRQASAFA